MSKKKPEPEPINFELDNAIPETILRAIGDDADYDSDEELTRFYRKLDPMQRAAVDVAMVRICGWSLDTLIRSAEKKLPVEECQAHGYNPFTILDGVILDSDLKAKT
jgi:hypothetical protein